MAFEMFHLLDIFKVIIVETSKKDIVAFYNDKTIGGKVSKLVESSKMVVTDKINCTQWRKNTRLVLTRIK